MKILFALLISFVYAAESSDLNDRTIGKTSGSGFYYLEPEIFHYIMTFLNAEEVLNLRFLSQGIYRRVRNLWPEMELSTIVDIYHPDCSVNFSHILKIDEVNSPEVQVLTYARAQLRYLREFTFKGSGIRNLQAMIDLLPRNSLTSLILINTEFPHPLIDKIDLPKLVHLELWYITMSDDAFSSLPNCIKVLKVIEGYMNTTTSISLAMTLKSMDKLEFFFLLCCVLSKDSFSVILQNLPASLRRLDISFIKLLDTDMNLLEPGLKRLKRMKHLQAINFVGTNHEVAIEIIANLPKCITNIKCQMDSETLNAFQKRLGEFTNVKWISFDHVTSPELYPIIRKIFPNLDEKIEKELYPYGL